jgi:hypothetical protein
MPNPPAILLGVFSLGSLGIVAGWEVDLPASQNRRKTLRKMG